LEGFEIVEFSIKVTGKKQNGILQLALTAVQGALSKIQDGDCRADNNARDQETAA
jgi:hypothetical protein